ncbi:MAG TPA: M20/M25/M40 family metallo-hydrolase [Thermoanaerobaculia bacterium]|jgi:acetylornithine deacetylase/succinyl-diaminopimelate desuccinylase-like protein|nr:M20/M25/M40 family metallo-hydrolase [Thermoanaerobaculia bacterium]
MSFRSIAVLLLAATLQTNVADVTKVYERDYASHLVPMLSEVLRFATTQFDTEGHAGQKAWIAKTAHDLGFIYRDAGPIDEIELPGPPGAPVLGLMVHGDVQPVDDSWSVAPFSGTADQAYVYGRGSADDKGPLVQALLAMKALAQSGIARTHTVRLLVGTDEESTNTDVTTYLKTHQAPDYTLVLDSNFPVVAGEKAWNSLSVTSNPAAERPGITKPYSVFFINAGLGASIVPDRAEVKLRWKGEAAASSESDVVSQSRGLAAREAAGSAETATSGNSETAQPRDPATANWEPLMAAINAAPRPADTRVAMQADGDTLWIVAYGHSAHAGVNLEGGRNALVALARVLEGKLPSGGADDLLAFVRAAGKDLYGTGLGITDRDPLWGRYAVNIATIKRNPDDPKLSTLTINIRRIPPRTGPELKVKMEQFVAAFNKRTGASLTVTGFYDDEPLAFDPNAKIIRRLLADYAAATGAKSPKPAISGGGTYAKRLPNSIAFGMWFPDKPYPGHDVDEKNPIADLQKGTKVLIQALVDIATGERIEGAFKR